MTIYGANTGTIGLTAGKWYWEAKLIGGDYASIGIMDHTMTSAVDEVGQGAHTWALGSASGEGYRNNNTDTTFGANIINDDEIVMMALDLTNNRLYFGIDGVWMKADAASGGDPTDGTGAISITAIASLPTTSAGAYFPACGDRDDVGGATWEMNFGGCSAFTVSSTNQDENGYGNFEFAVPSGYLAICSKNLGSSGG